MKDSLVIVESPTKVKTLGKFLGNNYLIRSTKGHIIDLPQKELGIKIENNFKPKYVIIKGREKILREIKTIVSKVKKIYLATDPDREGEAICFHLYEQLKKYTNGVFHRILFNEITKDAVLYAIKYPQKINQNKVEAQQARRLLDRLVGYKISPLLWQSVKGELSAGRVQSVATRLICEREDVIEKFIPKEYWEITAKLETEEKKQFEASLIKIDSKKISISDETTAKEYVEKLKTKKFLVDKIKCKQVKKRPAPPFITSTLQQEATRKLHFSVQKTMFIAQQLYEGVKLGKEGMVGLITYMRTDSTRIAFSAIEEVREYIKEKFDKIFLPLKPNYYKKTGSQDAHESIRPTLTKREPEILKSYLSNDQFALYTLIWQRFVASQMKEAIYDITTVDIKADNFLLRVSGKIIRFKGFIELYLENTENIQQSKEKEILLLPLKEKEQLILKELNPSQHFTQPPPRFTEASLVKELEENGIGRPSTYAPIISTLLERKYVEKERGKFIPTELGKLVNTILVENFPKIFKINFTAYLEEELDKVARGEVPWVKLLKDFYQPFNKELLKAQKNIKQIKKNLEEETGEICEICGKKMIKKWGRYGKFITCSGFPECKNTLPLLEGKKTETVDQKCPLCNNELLIRQGKFGKFIACSNFPGCKYTKSLSIGKCFNKGCNGEIIERKTKKGKKFYGCNCYPQCTVIFWDKPVNISCVQCGASFMIEKKSKLKCINKECRYECDK